MRHRRYSVRFGRQRSHYKATLYHLVRALIISKSIKTTKTKAKTASRLADKLVTLGKDKSVINQRKAFSVLRDRKLVGLLFDEIAPLFKNRNGGYTRVILIGNRRGDNAQMAILEFIERPAKPEVEKKKKEKAEKKETQGRKPAPSKVEGDIKTQAEEIKPAEEIKLKKEETAKEKKEEHRKEEHKKEALPQKEPKKQEKPIQKPEFFKKFFGRKGD